MSALLLLLCACVEDKAAADDSGEAEDTADTDTAHTDTDTDTDTDTTAPLDADGDGDPATTDCDDANPWVYVGAEEWCDPVDHDCDGEALEPDVCAKEQYVGALWSTSMLPPADWHAVAITPGGPVGDLDGDGAVEWVSACGLGCVEARDGVSVPSAVIHPGGRVGRDQRIDLDAQPWVFSDEGCGTGLGADVTEVGDTNGDGIPDLAFLAGDATGCGRVWLLHGPLGAPGTDVDDAAAVGWTSFDDSGFGRNGLVAGDYDGDGLADLAAGAPGMSEGGWASPRVWILGGQAAPESAPSLDDQPWMTGGERFGQFLDEPGDIDGDGLDELVVGEARAWYVLEGLDVATARGVVAADVAAEVYPSESTHDCFADLGDLDGDGYPERAFGDSRDDTNGVTSGAIRVLSGLDRRRVGLPLADVAPGSWLGSHIAEGVGQGCWRTHVSAAPLGELAWERNDGDDHGPGVVVTPLTGIPAPGTPIPTGWTLAPIHRDYPASPLGGFAVGDYTGDGYDGLQYAGYQQVQGEGPMGWVMVTGWEIPWDEPQYW